MPRPRFSVSVGLLLVCHFTLVAQGQPIPPLHHPQAQSPTTHSLTLSEFEHMALAGNPTLVQATSRIEAARGRALQAGLKPNPTVGYTGEEIGAGGSKGQHGIFIEQVVVTGGKLRLNRAMFTQDITQAEWLAVAQQYRVLNGVRTRFYQLLAMQKLLEVREGLVRISEDVVTTAEELVNVGQANRPDFLQARVEARQMRVALENARMRYQAAWRELAALVGKPDLPLAPLQGDLEALGPPLDEDAMRNGLLENSPEVKVALAELSRSQFALKRERAEPIPNLRLQGGTQYNFETRDQQVFAQVGVTLPLFDRNQGNILAAQAQTALAQAEVGWVELSLRQRFARAYARYRTARAVVEAYRKDTLRDSREAYELYQESFRQRRAAWPQVLVSQRTYFQISVEYYQAFEELRVAEVTLLGLLLTDGLEEPPNPSEGARPLRLSSGFQQESIGVRGQ